MALSLITTLKNSGWTVWRTARAREEVASEAAAEEEEAPAEEEEEPRSGATAASTGPKRKRSSCSRPGPTATFSCSSRTGRTTDRYLGVDIHWNRFVLGSNWRAFGFRVSQAFERVSFHLASRGMDKTPSQCREKIKKLKTVYRNLGAQGDGARVSRKIRGRLVQKLHQVPPNVPNGSFSSFFPKFILFSLLVDFYRVSVASNHFCLLQLNCVIKIEFRAGSTASYFHLHSKLNHVVVHGCDRIGLLGFSLLRTIVCVQK